MIIVVVKFEPQEKKLSFSVEPPIVGRYSSAIKVCFDVLVCVCPLAGVSPELTLQACIQALLAACSKLVLAYG